MSVWNRIQKKRISWYHLLFLSLLVLALPLKVNAEGESVAVTLEVEQVFTINSSATDIEDNISYELVSLEAGNPMPSGSSGARYSFVITGTDTKAIGPLTFDHAGIYLYELKMKMPAPPSGYHYETEAYQVRLFVKQTDETFSVETVIEKDDGSKTDSIIFKQSYTPLPSNPDLMPELSVRKTVSGDIPASPNDFTFFLTARDVTNPMPEGSVGGVKEIIITGSGENSFETWSYTREGVYYYDITEKIRRNTSYTYDESVYTVTDVVKDIDGQLVVTRTVTNEANKQVSACLFINQYKRKQKSGGGGGSNIKKTEPAPETQEEVESSTKEEIITGQVPGSSHEGDEDSDTGIGVAIPKVGDESRYELYIALFLANVLILIVFAFYLILRSSHRNQNVVKYVVLLLSASICLLLFSGYRLWEQLQIYQEGSQSYDSLKRQVWNPVSDSSGDVEDSTKQSLEIDFEALKKVNGDAVAWLYGPDTVIDYPVMQADDYSWYLHHLPDGTYHANGTLFLDYNCEDNFEGRLSIIYGHHMKSGQMFGSLKGYKKQEYFEQHPYLYLSTEQEDYRIELKYGCVIPAGEWRDQAFMYEINLDKLLTYAALKTTFESDVEYMEDDKFVVLATCSYEFADARYIVIGVLRSEDSASIIKK